MKTKRRRLRWWTLGSLMALVCLGLILAAYRFGWTGTGFPGKTVWDWLQLLIIPLALALAALVVNQANTRTERQIALEKQQEDQFQAYLDRMTELLLDKGLRTSPPGAEVRNVARVRTISILMQLDVRRVEYVLAFLREAGLMESPDPVVSFKQAQFTASNWSHARLNGINLSGADLSGADLSGAHLRGADLSNARLSNADLRHTDLRGTNLHQTDLHETDLRKVNAREANLHHANLCGTDLREANFGRTNLSGATLLGANLNAVIHITTTGKYHTQRVYERIYPNLRKAELQGTDLRGVKGLTEEHLAAYKAKGAIVDEDTTTSSSQSTAVSSSLVQSNNAQVLSTPPVQGNASTHDADGDHIPSSKPDLES